jgi:hypothetical protein
MTAMHGRLSPSCNLLAGLRHIDLLTPESPQTSLDFSSKLSTPKGLKRVSTCPHTLATLDTALLGKCQRNHRPFLELYDLGEVIGTGGYAVVRECVHKATGEKFAAKMMTVSESPVSGDRNIDREVHLFTNIFTCYYDYFFILL